MKEYAFDEFAVGSRYRTTFVLTEQIVGDYLECLGMSVGPGEPLPAAIFASMKPWYEALEGRFPQGTVHLKQTTEHYGHAYPGDRYDVEVIITDKYVKKERNYLVYETTFTRDNVLICRQKTTQILALA
jgi:hypothetical protein